MQGQYSLRSPAVKRLMKEAQELSEPTAQYHAQPLEDNLFEWHFTIRGPDGSDFEGGVYHGRIILPPDYPMKPPSIIILTPNGRFEINAKICLSISGHHPESWQPSWSIRTALLAIIGFMPTHGSGAIGSLDYTPEEKKRLARKSQEYKCPQCGVTRSILRPVSETSQADTEEAKELASQINFQGEKKDANKKADSTATSGSDTSTTSRSSSVTAPSSSPAAANGSTPPWQNMWPQFGGAATGMPQQPFNPFMQPPVTSGSVGAASNPPLPSGVNLSPHMAAVHAAMLQHMRAQRFRFAAFAGEASAPSSGETSTSQRDVATSAIGSPTSSTASPAATGSSPPITQGSGEASTPSSTNAPTATDGVRQRAPPVAAERTTASRVTAARQPAELPRRTRQQSRSSHVIMSVLIVIVAVAFLALLLRRLSMMGYVTFHQDADL